MESSTTSLLGGSSTAGTLGPKRLGAFSAATSPTRSGTTEQMIAKPPHAEGFVRGLGSLRGLRPLQYPGGRALYHFSPAAVPSSGYWTGAIGLVTPEGCEFPISRFLGNSIART